MAEFKRQQEAARHHDEGNEAHRMGNLVHGVQDMVVRPGVDRLLPELIRAMADEGGGEGEAREPGAAGEQTQRDQHHRGGLVGRVIVAMAVIVVGVAMIVMSCMTLSIEGHEHQAP